MYKYNQITKKIGNFFRGIFDFLSYLLYLLIINPTKKTYEALKYVFLLKWIPGKKTNIFIWLSNVKNNYVQVYGSIYAALAHPFTRLLMIGFCIICERWEIEHLNFSTIGFISNGGKIWEPGDHEIFMPH